MWTWEVGGTELKKTGIIQGLNLLDLDIVSRYFLSYNAVSRSRCLLELFLPSQDLFIMFS